MLLDKLYTIQVHYDSIIYLIKTLVASGGMFVLGYLYLKVTSLQEELKDQKKELEARIDYEAKLREYHDNVTRGKTSGRPSLPPFPLGLRKGF